jgi:ABC-2 type transport system ATP-binding protein
MIEIVGLSKRFGRTVAVDHLSFTVTPGSVTGFLGPNGAGKSTTMRMVVGLDRPDAGRALVSGQPYRELRHPLRVVGALLDARWTHPRRSARAHLRWLARSNDIPTRRVDEVLNLVGLASVGHHKAGGFSLGMAQRLGIAAALLGDPEVLLFDEPVNGLDPEGIHWIRALMRNLAAEGRTVLVSSHLLTEMAVTADRLVVIGRGRLIAESPVADFVARAGAAVVRVRSPQPQRLATALAAQGFAVSADGVVDGTGAITVTDATTDRVGEIAGEAGIALYELTAQTASLEQAYIALTSGAVDYRSGETADAPGRARAVAPAAPGGRGEAPLREGSAA